MTRPQERLLMLLLIGTAIFNKADFFLTVEALDRGFREANPILKPMIDTHEFPLVKLILVPLMLLFLWQNRERVGSRLVGYVWIPFLSYLSLMLYFRFHILL